MRVVFGRHWTLSLFYNLDSFTFKFLNKQDDSGKILHEGLNTERGHFQVEGSMANEWDKDGYNGEESRTKRNGIR